MSPTSTEAPDLTKEGTTKPGKDILTESEVLWVGFPDLGLVQALEKAAEARALGRVFCSTATSIDEADEILASCSASVLALGPDLGWDAVLEFVLGLEKNHPYQRPAIVVVGVGDDLSRIQPLVQADRLFYLSRAQLPVEDLVVLGLAALEFFRSDLLLELAASGHSKNVQAAWLRRNLLLGDVLQEVSDVEAFSEPILEVLYETVGVDGGRLWLCDRLGQALTAVDHADLEVSVVAGLTSWVARTGRSLSVTPAIEDPRHDSEADGEAQSFLAVPILGPNRWVFGVLAMWRQEKAPFSVRDRELAEGLAETVAPHMALYTPRPLETMMRLKTSGVAPDLFRSEAVEASSRGFSERGRVLRNNARWTQWTWATLVTGFVAAFLFLILGQMHDYASGSAVVRIGDRVEVTSHLAAAVTAVLVEPAQEVRAGQSLVRFYGAPEASEIANLEEEFDQRLRQRLAAPADTAVETSLVDIRSRLERARTRLADRIVRAPVDGVVGDVRIRPGQHLVAGEVLLSVVADPDKRSVVGLIPGQFGPQIEVGQSLRLTLQGYQDLSFDLVVEAVGEEVIGSQAARLSAARSIAEMASSAGPVVLVRARLPESSFRDGGQSWTFRDGMLGEMEIQVRSHPILFHLVPGLDRAVGRWHGG